MIHKNCLSKKGWEALLSLKALIHKRRAILAGGTGLALQIGHRISEDLDLFTTTSFKNEPIFKAIKQLDFPYQMITEGEDYLTLFFNEIKISLFKYDYPFQEKAILINEIPLASITDVASMKVITISQRGTKRDFVDLYFILQEMPFHKLARHMVKRYSPPRINPIHIGKSLTYFFEADSEPEPVYTKGSDVPWEKIKKFFKQHAKQYVFDLDIAIKETKKK